MLWELHEIRHELHKELSCKSVEDIRKKEEPRRRRNIRHGVLPEPLPETVRRKHAGIYGNLFLPVIVNALSVIRTVGKVISLSVLRNVIGQSEKKPVGRLISDVSAIRCVSVVPIRSEKCFLSVVIGNFMKNVSVILLTVII
jgi:hypothetical protein